ncbi:MULTISPECIES: glycosyltransferase [unclassified Bradyrhizobium]|uniref:glycosyltransferase n=1 Tax=unclassified Bradyrhizobium TaxID=2631580 RepID=UPI001FF7DA91|nr:MULTISPECIES: glycosyltransferase [unclassified Bradyrhizobium]MCK1712902.1 glucuronosyltransferase [Bradyrhizobium sp. 143]MCK1730776.1 glucuronosyltransferase [Bradyrhizobium sp. 142]
MILVTVGTQVQFDRLIRTVDDWAGARARNDVFAQIGPSNQRFKHIRTERFIEPTEFRNSVEAASLVVAHAGMGSIITALELGKKILVMPRRASLGEHRNDHQVATAKRFAAQGRIEVAFDEGELADKLDHLDVRNGSERLGGEASPQLIRTLRTFIEAGRVRSEPTNISA